MDRYRIYTITYGKTGYFHSNGPINGHGNIMAYADMIKEYYLMAGLQEDYLSSTIESVGYWDGSTYQSLEEVLMSSTSAEPLGDLRDVQIREVWASGLVLYLNHSEESWSGVEAAGTTFTIPEDGWVAHNPTTGLLTFSAIPASLESAGQRIDYASVPNRYEALDGRGAVVSYGNLSNPEGWLVVSNKVHDLVVTELESGEITAVVGTPPTLDALSLRGPNRMYIDTTTLFKAQATMSNGAKQEFPYTLGSWNSTNPTVATVNRAGVVSALGAGETEISFTADGVTSNPRTVLVEIQKGP